MPRWWSICALITVIIIVAHTLASFYQPGMITWRTDQSHPESPLNSPVKETPPDTLDLHRGNPQTTKHPEPPNTHLLGEEIVLVVGTDGKSHQIPGMKKMVRQNREDYVKRHGTLTAEEANVGYEFFWANFSEYKMAELHPVWSKVPVLADAFDKYPKAKWVWWLDIDAIIMTPTIDLSSHLLNAQSMYQMLRKGESYQLRGAGRAGVFDLPENPDPEKIHMLISGDHNGINAGSFFLRRSEWTDMFLDLWLDPFYISQTWPGKEQDAIIHMLQHHKFVQEHVGILPQRSINAYCEGDENMRWHTGDLVVHFAGCWVADKCEERWNEFWKIKESQEQSHTPHENLRMTNPE